MIQNNTWGAAKEGPFANHVELGRLVIIPGDDWDSGAELTDASVSDTWEEADFSSFVPVGTNGLYIYAEIYSTDTQDVLTLLLRGDGETGGTSYGFFNMTMAGELGASANLIGCPYTVYAPGGIFDYRRKSSSQPITELRFVLRGYYHL